MKKKLLLSVSICALAFQVLGQTKITNNPVQVINSGNSVTCNAGGVLVTDNSFYQIYDLDNYTNITDTAFFVRMKVGCESTTGGAYNIVGAVHTLVGTPNLANMTFIADDTLAIYPDSTMYLVNIIFGDGYALPGDSLAAELKLPTSATVGFYPASNTSPESSPTYIVATGCSINDLTTMAAVGFPTMHLIMNFYVNQKPAMVGFSSSIFKNDSVYFSTSDFTSNFTDNDNDGLTMIRVTTLPANGVLDLNGTVLALGDTILTSEMDMLYYIPTTGYSGNDNFSFSARDSSHWSNTPAVYDVTVVNWQVGIDETTDAKIALYPNPASKQITLETTEQIEAVKIFNADGKLVRTIISQDKQIDVSGLQPGTYFLEVKTASGISTSRFIKS